MKTTFLLFLFCFSVFFGFSQAGNIDTNFHIGTGFNQAVNAVGLQADNKILIGTSGSYNGSQFNSLIRLKPNGLVDSTFYLGAAGLSGTISEIVYLKDSTILVGGGFATLNGNTISNLFKLDFNGNHITSFNPVFNGAVTSIEIDTNLQKIYVGGYFTTVNNIAKKHLVRLNMDGSIDNTFSIGSGFTGTFGQSPVYCLRIQPDSCLLVGGEFLMYNNSFSSNICRILPNGMIDTNFVCSNGVGFNNSVSDIELLNNNRIIVGGNFSSYNGVSNVNYLTSLMMDGTLDVNFNIAAGFSGNVNSIAISKESRIIVGGNFNYFNNISTRNLVQLNPNGSRNFGFDIGAGFQQSMSTPTVNDIVVQNDSNILVGGIFTSYDSVSTKNLVRIIGKGSVVVSLPVLTTNVASLITNTSVRCGGNITDDGNGGISSRGVCWSTSQNPDITGNHSNEGTGIGMYESNIHSLQDSTKYYLRAYATNAAGTAYGNQISFTTKGNMEYTCGNVTFVYNNQSVTYGTVKGKYGRCWLDRNLGAERVADYATDNLAYGHYFQWGRKADGHQEWGAATTTTVSSGSTAGNSAFVIVSTSPYSWTNSSNVNLWNGLNADNNPCPTGWRVPTQSELAAEMTLWTSDDMTGAFESGLRIPTSGVKGYLSGIVTSGNIKANLWTSEAFLDNGVQKAKALTINDTMAIFTNSYWALGASVRCIKDYTDDIQKIENDELMYFYPNPAKTNIFIRLNNTQFIGANISLMNNLGEIIYSKQSTNMEETLDISFLENGIYFLVVSNNYQQSIKKLIITR